VPLTTAQVRELLARGETDRVEFARPTSYLKTAMRYASDIAAFANGDGGVLILGYDERDGTVDIGDPAVARRAIERALTQIEPPVHTYVQEHQVDDGIVVTVEVQPSDQIHFANGTVAVRHGDRTCQ
jgi:predicted HTH transcriptional regulator